MKYKKIITWNVNSIKKRIDQVKDLLQCEDPDYLLLQETRVGDQNFPFIDGYHVYTEEGEKGRAGVAIISKEPMQVVEKFEGRYIECQDDFFSVSSIYVYNGGSPSASVEQKINLLNVIYEKASEKYKYIIGGDFNVLYKSIECTATNPYSKQEMHTFKRLEEVLSYQISATPYLTWWDYRDYALQRGIGMGIDKIFVTKDIIHYSSNVVLKKYRALSSPSDHAPVMINITMEN